MSRGKNQKFKLYRLAQIMLNRTDDNHYLTMAEIISALEEYGVTADRKSIYQNLRDLEECEIAVERVVKGNKHLYHVVHRPFELAELKILVDAIQSSKFITEQKSRILIAKLEWLLSKYEAASLNRQIFVSDRVKSMNESIYYTVDAIHNAINSNRKLIFRYFNWNEKKEKVFRHNGEYYNISPWNLCWDNHNYYMIGYDSKEKKIKHYRVDKMANIHLSNENRDGKEKFEKFNMVEYTNKNFEMFGGKEENVELTVDNDLAGVIIDRFGRDLIFAPYDETHFKVNVKVNLSRLFFGWVASLGDGVKITRPERIVKQMKQEIKRVEEQYK